MTDGRATPYRAAFDRARMTEHYKTMGIADMLHERAARLQAEADQLAAEARYCRQKAHEIVKVHAYEIIAWWDFDD